MIILISTALFIDVDTVDLVSEGLKTKLNNELALNSYSSLSSATLWRF
jgi:hypothetical protein